MKTTINAILDMDVEVHAHYTELLKSYKLDKMDAVVMEFEHLVRETEGQLPNERIRYYSGMFAYYAYALNATLSRQGLRSDIARIYKDAQYAKSFVAEPQDQKKLTREDKQALSTLATEEAEKAEMLFARVTQAIESRIKAFNKLLETLNMLGAMNMSEAKLGAK